jgi:hypothetical protein
MRQDAMDRRLVFNATDEVQLAAATALINVDLEHSLESLCPSHGPMAFVAWLFLPTVAYRPYQVNRRHASCH